DAEERDTDESTRQPTLGYLSVGMFPTAIDSCNDVTELTVVLENTGGVDAHNVDLVVTLPDNVTYNVGSSRFGQGADSGVGVNPIGDPDPTGGVLTWYDVDVKGVGSDLTGVIEAGGDPNDTAVLKFEVESSCYTTANMAFDIRYYSCCDDTQYSTTRNLSLAAEFPDLAITKTPVSSAPACGADQTWEITVTNNGDGQAQIVNIADSPGDWIDVRTSEASDPVLLPGGGYGWEIMNLAATGDPGDSQTFTLV
ncbi:MAG: hypothetical protein GY842_14555, partial [bacterium]|nr:hypothetical protein [bacterium]